MKQLKSLNKEWEFTNCNLCGSDNFKEISSYNEIKIVRCNDCGLIYRNPRLKENLNREFYSFVYYGEYEGIEERISNARLVLFKKVLLQLNKKIKFDSKRLLDIGCGQGHFLKMAKELGWQVQGLELAKAARDYAKQKFDIDIMNKDLHETNFADDSFEVITLWNTLDHLLDPLGTLREIRRILKPDGILVIRVPNVNFHLFAHKIFSFLPILSKNKKLRDPSVIVNYGFSSKTLRKILQKAGFKDIGIYNSPLSSGDPYRTIIFLHNKLINIFKYFLSISSQIVFIISSHKLFLSSSLIAYAK